MENLSPESIIKKNEENKENKNENLTDKEIKEDENKIKEVEKEGELGTNFEEDIDLTEEEKKLRKNYLKNISKKEALYRSIILGKGALIIKFYNLFMELFQEFLNIKEVTYKSDAINSITKKDLDTFIMSIKYLIITIIILKIINLIERKLHEFISEKFSEKNITEIYELKKNILFLKYIK